MTRPVSTARLGRATGVMAVGTVFSRGTGFVRTIAITAAIGTRQVGDAYNVANTTPNIIYDLLLGGVLTSVVVPVLVRASKDDEDGGEGFANSLLTLVGLGSRGLHGHRDADRAAHRADLPRQFARGLARDHLHALVPAADRVLRRRRDDRRNPQYPRAFRCHRW